jgi:hypothetical protein
VQYALPIDFEPWFRLPVPVLVGERMGPMFPLSGSTIADVLLLVMMTFAFGDCASDSQASMFLY